MRHLNLLPVLLSFLSISCATSSSQTTSGKPYDFCICGPTIDAEGKPYCAIWGENKNPALASKTFASDARASCEPNDCSQLFSKFCQKIQMSGVAKPTPQAAVGSCYCDVVLVENDKGQVTLNCAAWAEGGKNLIEYYNLDDCSPTRCGDAPFNLAPKVCNNSFRNFYAPLLNKR
jgi:hypothetical protein